MPHTIASGRTAVALLGELFTKYEIAAQASIRWLRTKHQHRQRICPALQPTTMTTPGEHLRKAGRLGKVEDVVKANMDAIGAV
jgi:hypothetical protein